MNECCAARCGSGNTESNVKRRTRLGWGWRGSTEWAWHGSELQTERERERERNRSASPGRGEVDAQHWFQKQLITHSSVSSVNPQHSSPSCPRFIGVLFSWGTCHRNIPRAVWDKNTLLEIRQLLISLIWMDEVSLLSTLRRKLPHFPSALILVQDGWWSDASQDGEVCAGAGYLRAGLVPTRLRTRVF